MTPQEKDDLFYVCSLIEFTARSTNNRRSAIVNAIGKKGIEKQLYDARVNHCLTFEQVSQELIEKYNIQNGDFDTITNCKYSIPSFLSIGRLYSYIIIELCKDGRDKTDELIKVFNSFISDKISDFKTGIYFENISYLKCCYEEGHLLAP